MTAETKRRSPSPDTKNINEIKGSRNTTLSQGIFSLSKSAVGAGTLALPFVFAELGLVNGLIMLVFGSLSTTMMLYFLGRLAAKTDQSDYYTIGRLGFGRAGELISMLATVLFLFGGLIAYVAIAGGYFSSFLIYIFPKLGEFKGLHYIVNPLTSLLILPLALLRDMSALSKASMIGMVGMGYILILTIFDFFYDSTGRAAANIQAVTAFQTSKFFVRFSTILFAFVNHFTILSIVPSMIDPTPSRRLKLTFGSAGVILGFYLLVSLFGYLHYGSAVPSNILEINPTDKFSRILYRTGSLLMGVVIVLSYPLLLDPCRSTILGAIALFSGKKNTSSSSLSASIAVTLALMLVSTTIATVAFKAADKILGLFVGFAGTLLVFILPSGLFLRLQPQYQYRVAAWERILAYAAIVFGLIVMVVSTFFSAKDLFQFFAK